MWKYKSRSLGDKLDHSLTKESLQLLLLPFYGSDVDARPNEKLWETAMASIFAMQLLSLLQAQVSSLGKYQKHLKAKKHFQTKQLKLYKLCTVTAFSSDTNKTSLPLIPFHASLRKHSKSPHETFLKLSVSLFPSFCLAKTLHQFMKYRGI